MKDIAKTTGYKLFQRLMSLKPRELNRTEYCKLLNMSANNLMNYERGQEPTLKMLERLSVATGKSVDWLLGKKSVIPIKQFEIISPQEDNPYKNHIDYVYLPEEVIDVNEASSDIIAWQINSDNMQPTIPSDSILFIDIKPKTTLDTFISNQIYIVFLELGSVSVHRVNVTKKMIALTSDNPEYSPAKAWTIDLDLLIVGRVIWWHAPYYRGE